MMAVSGLSSGTMRIYINERPFDAGGEFTVLSAVRAFDGELADRIDAGVAYVTDGRGIRLAGTEPVGQGAILRVVTRSRTASEPGC